MVDNSAVFDGGDYEFFLGFHDDVTFCMCECVNS